MPIINGQRKGCIFGQDSGRHLNSMSSGVHENGGCTPVPRQVGWLESPSRGHRWRRTRLGLYETQMRTKPDLRAKMSDHNAPLRRRRAAAPAIGGGHSGKRRIRSRECRSGKADFEALDDDGEPSCASVIDINLGEGPDEWAVAGTQRFANKGLDAIMFRTGNSLHSESVGS
jgi:hypothetical protein